MATKGSAPKPNDGYSNRSRSYSPGSKQMDSSIQDHKGPTQVSDGGLQGVFKDDPEKATSPSQTTGGVPS